MLPPPPPSPPPAIENKQSFQPTFIEQWLENEKTKSQPTKQNKREYFENQCLFPIKIPSAAMCNMEPLISLASHFETDHDGDHGSGGPSKGVSGDSHEKVSSNPSEKMTPTHWTTLDDMRKIASHCAKFKSMTLLNHSEFKYKRAIKLKEELHREQESSTMTNISQNANSSIKSASVSTLPLPPYHAEYTPLSYPENLLLARIHSANYNLCLADAACPERTKRLLLCWKGLDPQWVSTMEHAGLSSYICLEEREAVERCVGLGVQQVMKDVLG